ncbi:MAG: dTMP kinase [Alphaproteobacteria bacterium]|nr:dTMP kinase [Alphaproteobacteria bacterium]
MFQYAYAPFVLRCCADAGASRSRTTAKIPERFCVSPVKFITFEGIEGCGKSTQAKKLHEFLTNSILTREPGGTPAGEAIRKILIDENIAKLEAKTELFLNFAARLEHVEKLIKPALAAGRVVISDRFFDSSYAYQGSAFGLDGALIDEVRKMTIGSFSPDITFLIDLPVDTAFARIGNRTENNRYEKLGRDFHQRVRDGFLHLAKNNPRIRVVDGARSPERIFQEILTLIPKS